ncbi:MAG: hypothetical protein AAFV86_00945 [Pseudomonadota bacterium]
MLLSEADPGPVPTPPLGDFKEHLRLGHGFADDGSEDALLARILEAAVLAVERRVARALVTRRFTLAVSRLDRGGCVALPVGPVSVIEAAAIREGAAEAALDVSTWRVSAGSTGQRVSAAGGALPAPADGAQLVMTFPAGLAADWASVPADLEQAVLLLAAHFYARRGTEDGGRREALPVAVDAILAAWAPVRA